jgi:glyoxylase-like metal-dependent hydrolase (beta-lactamase superfamily II)
MPSTVLIIAPDILRILAKNPSVMTGTGTNSYVLGGSDGAVVIDPGPDLPGHRDAMIAAIAGRPVAAILVTHAHLDHSEMAPWLAAQTGARIMSFGVPAQTAAQGEGTDFGHRPDVTLKDGMQLDLAGLAIWVLHTPGHMQRHLCFGYGDVLFSGDHVMGWSTSLIAPPEGDMAQYRASLARLMGGHWRVFLPGHGAPVTDPAARLTELIAHRAAREAQILAALVPEGGTASTLATQIYTDLNPTLLPAAARNVLAHLIDLERRSCVTSDAALGDARHFHLIAR